MCKTDRGEGLFTVGEINTIWEVINPMATERLTIQQTRDPKRPSIGQQYKSNQPQATTIKPNLPDEIQLIDVNTADIFRETENAAICWQRPKE